MMQRELVVSMENVGVVFHPKGRRSTPLSALQDVNLEVEPGTTVGVVGESGSGKTTLGRVVLAELKPTTGSVSVCGVRTSERSARRHVRGRLQVVLQNPEWSLNPALHVWRTVAEPLATAGKVGRAARRTAAAAMLDRVGLNTSLLDRRPHELSGGQRQRVSIARAMITSPDLIVFDEAVTALDASVQANILNLIRDLQAERGFSTIFISHDIAAVRYVSNHIIVMREGRIVEQGPVSRFYGVPDHPYSQELLATLAVHPGHTPRVP